MVYSLIVVECDRIELREFGSRLILCINDFQVLKFVEKANGGK